MDTDSLTYEVQMDDIYEDMKRVEEETFDCSDYPTGHTLYSEMKKKRVGCCKDENSSDSLLVILWVFVRNYTAYPVPRVTG